MANVNTTTIPISQLSLKNIRPCWNPIIFGFNTFESGIFTISTANVYFFVGVTAFTAIEGDYIEINGNRILFKDVPKFGELTTSAFSSIIQATRELFRILKTHPTLKNEYQINIINTTPAYPFILMSANSRTTLLDITGTVFGASNVVINTTPGLASWYGGDTEDWSMFVEVFACTDDDKRNLMDQNPFNPTLVKKSVLLELNWQGLLDNDFIAQEKIMNFDFSTFLQQFLKVLPPFNQNGLFFLQKEAIVRYFYAYGEKIGNQYIEIDSPNINTQFPYFSHFSQLSNELNPYSHLPITVSPFYTNDLDAAFLRYWKRFISPAVSYNLIDLLTLQPQYYRIQLTQKLFLSFIYDYQIFNISETLGVPQDTVLFLQYDLYFEDGTFLLQQNKLSTVTIINYFCQTTIEATLDEVQILSDEAGQLSMVKSVAFRVMEFLLGDSIATARQVTNDKLFTLDNDNRNYKNDSEILDSDQLNHNFGELLFLNSLGGWDTIFCLGEIVENVEITNDLFDKNFEYPNEFNLDVTTDSNNDVVDSEVLNIDFIKTVDAQIQYSDKETFIYYQQLLKSSKIYFRKYGEILDFTRVSIANTNYSNSYNEDIQQFSVKFRYLLSENHV